MTVRISRTCSASTSKHGARCLSQLIDWPITAVLVDPTYQKVTTASGTRSETKSFEGFATNPKPPRPRFTTRGLKPSTRQRSDTLWIHSTLNATHDSTKVSALCRLVTVAPPSLEHHATLRKQPKRPANLSRDSSIKSQVVDVAKVRRC